MAKQSFILLFLLFSIGLFAQEKEKDSLSIISEDSVAVKKNLKKIARIKKREAREQKNIRPYNALAPSKAAFYSAVLPGL